MTRLWMALPLLLTLGAAALCLPTALTLATTLTLSTALTLAAPAPAASSTAGAAGIDDEHELAFLPGLDGLLGHDGRLLQCFKPEADACELSRPQAAI